MPHVQIRDIEPEVVATLRVRAAAEYLTMAQFLRRELRRLAAATDAQRLLARADERRERTQGGIHRDSFDAVVESW